MIYTSRFYNIYDELFTVTIKTPTGTATQSITLADNPFTVKLKGSEDDLYKPVRCSGATVRIVSSSYHFDMYAAAIGDVTVLVQRQVDNSWETVWSGFVTPCVYDQGYDTNLEIIEIECIDTLSALQYFKYENAEVTSKYPQNLYCDGAAGSGMTYVYHVGTGSFLAPTFYDVIRTCLSRVAVTGIDSESIYGPFPRLGVSDVAPESLIGLHHLRVLNENFFKEKEGDEEEQDAWTCLEVLESLNRYLGTTFYVHAGKYYMVDFDSIGTFTQELTSEWNESTAILKTGAYVADSSTCHNDNNYADRIRLLPYKLTDQQTSVDANNEIKMTYSASGTNLSLDEVYNKVSVKAEPYTFDEIVPDPFENATNVTTAHDPEITGTWQLGDGGLCESVGVPGDYTEVLLDFPYSPDDDEYAENYNALFIKYLQSDSIQTFLYTDAGARMPYPASVAYSDTRTWNGAIMAQLDVTKCDKRKVHLEEYLSDYIDSLNGTNLHEKLDKALTYNNKSTMKLSNYICMFSNSDSVNWSSRVFAQCNTAPRPVGNNSYVQISGSVSFHEFPDDPYPIPEDEVDIKKGKYKINRETAFLAFKLQAVVDGTTMYWNGRAWVTSDKTFTIPYVLQSMQEDDLRADALMFKDLKLQNTNTWRQGLEKDGYTIPLPEDWTNAVFTLYLYGPPFPTYSNKGTIHKPRCMFLKDFKFNMVTGDPTYTGILDTDTVYTNVINERFVSEKDEITFKTCTYDDKKSAYSSVMLNNNYLREYYNEALGVKYGESDAFVAEEHCIRRYANQYSTPSVILDTNVRTSTPPDPRRVWKVTSVSGDRTYVMDSYTMNYHKASAKIRLVEKK